MTSQTGRCLCGAVRYRFTGEMLRAGHCHCESCSRNTSSPVTTFFVTPLDGFAFEGEEPGAYASSPGVIRHFCPICGTPMSYETAQSPDEIHLYAASLDDDSGFAADRHDFWGERVAWLTVVDDLPKNEH